MTEEFVSKWEILNTETEDQLDEIILPPPERKKLDNSGLFLETSFVRDEESKEVKMCERTIKISETTKRISKSSEKRHETWVKFGSVKNIPKGTSESGITTVHSEEISFKWFGFEEKKNKPMRRPKYVPPPPMPEERPKPEAPKYYRAPIPTTIEEVYELKIQNLPESVEPGDIRTLVNAFYYNVLKTQPPRRYRITVRTSYRDEEKWSIVEFNSKKWRDIAVEKLNGYRYKHQLLEVRASQPRPRN